MSDISKINRTQPTGPPFYIPVHGQVYLLYLDFVVCFVLFFACYC